MTLDSSIATSARDAASEASPGDPPSCNGIDGLTPTTAVLLVLDQGARPNDVACFGWSASAVNDLPQVTLASGGGGAGYELTPLTRAAGEFVSSTSVGCRGTWSFALGPRSRVSKGTMVSPLDADASGNPWVIERDIDIAQAQFCDGFFAAPGAVYCGDTFAVHSIVEVP